MAELSVSTLSTEGIANGMKRFRDLTLSALLASASLLADSDTSLTRAQTAFEDKDYSTAIEQFSQALEHASSDERGEILVQLALCHYRDQDDIAAFSTFLRALQNAPSDKAAPINEEEQQLCAEALEVYLDPNQRNPRETAVLLRQQVAPQIAAHPEYHYLGFFLAAAYANLGMFDSFFETFFSSYSAHPNSYMAYKTSGLLHMKLYERLADRSAREKQREQAVACFEEALTKNPVDVGLMKMIIGSTPDKQRKEVVERITESVLEQGITIPRRDVLFFVRATVDAGNPDLGRQLMEQAREWYGFSRSLTAAEKLLEDSEQSKS